METFDFSLPEAPLSVLLSRCFANYDQLPSVAIVTLLAVLAA